MKASFNVKTGGPKHKCAVEGCGLVVPIKLLMCPEHWAALPEGIKRAVQRAFRNLELQKSLESVQAYREAVARAREFINSQATLQ